MQPDMAEIGRLVDAILVVEEQPQAVGGVERLGQLLLDQLFMRDEVDLRIGIAQQRNEQAGHGAGHPAAMLGGEPRGIGKPRQDVAERADRELDQDVAAQRVVLVRQHRGRLAGRVKVPHLDAEADVVPLGGAD
jgi:hypothetical protein